GYLCPNVGDLPKLAPAAKLGFDLVVIIAPHGKRLTGQFSDRGTSTISGPLVGSGKFNSSVIRRCSACMAGVPAVGARYGRKPIVEVGHATQYLAMSPISRDAPWPAASMRLNTTGCIIKATVKRRPLIVTLLVVRRRGSKGVPFQRRFSSPMYETIES